MKKTNQNQDRKMITLGNPLRLFRFIQKRTYEAYTTHLGKSVY